MLRRFCTFLAVFLMFENVSAQPLNEIDVIEYNKDVNTFLLKTLGDKNYYYVDNFVRFDNNICRELFDSLRIETWDKLDIDQNGFTDLFCITGSNHAFCILDSGVNKFYYKALTTNGLDCQLFSADSDSNYIKLYDSFWVNAFPYKDTLVEEKIIFKFGEFIKFNDKPSDHKIEKIELGFGGEISWTKIEIRKNRKLRTQHFIFGSKRGFYRNRVHKISKTDYQNIVDYLNYLNFTALKDEYPTLALDGGGSVLTITYDNGQIKKIRDNGLGSPFSLQHFYSLMQESFFKLQRENKLKQRKRL
jgi:hypothetical protein